MFFFDKQGLFPQRVSTGTGLDLTQRRLAAVSEIMGKIEGDRGRQGERGREGAGVRSCRGTDEDGGGRNEE